MDGYQKLLLGNKAWVRDRLTAKPDYFQRAGQQERPEFLWIGCSDSHVAAEEITGAEPGELFVHRNIANMVVPTDVNLLGVVQYAVEELQVPNVIVCGHYNCGGLKNAMSRKDLGGLNPWLRYLKDLYGRNRREMETIEVEQTRWIVWRNSTCPSRFKIWRKRRSYGRLGRVGSGRFCTGGFTICAVDTSRRSRACGRGRSWTRFILSRWGNSRAMPIRFENSQPILRVENMEASLRFQGTHNGSC